MTCLEDVENLQTPFHNSYKNKIVLTKVNFYISKKK